MKALHFAGLDDTEYVGVRGERCRAPKRPLRHARNHALLLKLHRGLALKLNIHLSAIEHRVSDRRAGGDLRLTV